MEDLASLGIGTYVRIDDVALQCISRIPVDRWDDLIVLHDLALDLDHPASLTTLFGSALVDLHRLGRISLDRDDDAAMAIPPVPAFSAPRDALDMTPAT